MKLEDLERKLDYSFVEKKHLENALTHSSYTHENGLGRIECNERLEFLGDAFFDAIIGEELYKRLPDVTEGVLTKKRALIVCEDSLADIAEKCELGSLIKLGQGEELTGGRKRESILADAMESIIGAVFLDGGYEDARKMVLDLFGQKVEDAMAGRIHGDDKSELQGLLQKSGPVNIRYILDKQIGPDHDKTFFVTVIADGKPLGKGKGKSKKEAEKSAAAEALENILKEK